MPDDPLLVSRKSEVRIGSNGPAAQAPVNIRERRYAKRHQAALEAAKQPGVYLCPRCEGQKFDRDACALCRNTGVLRDA